MVLDQSGSSVGRNSGWVLTVFNVGLLYYLVD